jgi:Holliday junction resolvase-like predicted endonuclease
MVSALEEFKEFEKRADIEIAKLSLWKQPIRSILSLIYLSADAQYVGKRFNRKSPRNEEVGTAMITRMSYVARFFGKCSREVGTDIDDALSVANDQFKADIEQLLGYAHFCEIMPLARRGFFSIERHASGFVLRHPSKGFVKHEENDILMSEMALPHDTARPPYPFKSCTRIIKAWPQVPGDALVEALKGAYDHYINNVFEFPLLSEAAFQEGFDFSRTDFIRMRAALMAYADFCLGMADAAEVLSERVFTRPKRETLQREVREWVSPLLSRNHIIGVAAGLSGVELSAAERIVNIFSIDPDSVDGSGTGEGFFPPFLRLKDSLLFSPHALKRSMPERNLLFTMVRTDRESFDNVVSSHLEPTLIEETAAYLLELPGVEVRKNVNWDKGEIDLLAYHDASNSAFQLQAKAGVPPQGARMVAQVESRTLEAAKQVERFLALSGDEKDKICSSAIGRKLLGVSWSNGILVRTCLGTEKAWAGIRGIVPLNPSLLRAAIKRMSEGSKFTFMNLGEVAEVELERFRAIAVLGWENKSFTLFGEKIELPLLNLNHTAASDFRRRALSRK